MIVAITGGRDYHPSHRQCVALVRWLGIVRRSELVAVPPQVDLFAEPEPDVIGASLVVHGGSKGTDTVVSQYITRFSRFKCEAYRADWDKFRKWAGPRRNGQMLVRDRREHGGIEHRERASALVAWPGGYGTADCTEQARALGIRVLTIGEVQAAVRASERVQA